MKDSLNRRDFLKYSLATGTVLLAGDAFKGGSVAQERIKMSEVDKLTVWVLTDNYYDAARPDTKISKHYRGASGKSIHAEHGIAYYVETLVDGKVSGCMFDYGLDPIGVMNNIAALGLDIGKANAFSLSHGHVDHWMASVEIIRKSRDRIAKSTPFYVGEEAFLRRFALPPGADKARDLGKFKKADIEQLGLKVLEVKNPTQIIPGAYLTGNIERVTAYEKVPPMLLVNRGEKPEPDDFRGEQALFFNVKGKGLVVLSGCAHAGIVNTVKHCRKIAAIGKIHAVMGGFHLINAKPEVIQNTVVDMKAMKPDFIVPAHCTGFEAIVAFAKEMPNEFNLNTAGTKYTFLA